MRREKAQIFLSTNENCSSRMQEWCLSRISQALIPPMKITISWSKTFPITLQLFIDFATLILSGFHQKWTIFSPLNGSGQLWLSEYFVRLAQKQLLL